MQAHGSDAMVDEENCVFFLPHRPRSEICGPPFFLFMKGTGRYNLLIFLICYFKTIAIKLIFEVARRVMLYYLLLAGWCAGGADHYEPVVAHPSTLISQEKVAMVLWGQLGWQFFGVEIQNRYSHSFLSHYRGTTWYFFYGIPCKDARERFLIRRTWFFFFFWSTNIPSLRERESRH